MFRLAQFYITDLNIKIFHLIVTCRVQILCVKRIRNSYLNGVTIFLNSFIFDSVDVYTDFLMIF